MRSNMGARLPWPTLQWRWSLMDGKAGFGFVLRVSAGRLRTTPPEDECELA
jgi:hypothetical protein